MKNSWGSLASKFLGAALVLSCLVVVYYFESHGGPDAKTTGVKLLHWPALLLTGIGPLGLVLLSSDLEILSRTLKAVYRESPRAIKRRSESEREILGLLLRRYHTLGTRAFEGIEKSKLSPELMRTLERLELRIPVADARSILDRERERLESELQESGNVLGLAVKLTPSVGMLGTILGMVQLLSKLKDPSEIGSSMSMALLTTFFGLFFSLAVWTPLAQGLERLRDAKLEWYDQLEEWLDLLEARKPADYLSGGSPSVHGSA